MKLGIIGAMEQEVKTLQAAMEHPTVTTKAGMTFYEGSLRGTPAVVVQSGVGKVNAALCVQCLCDLFAVTHILNTGIAGALSDQLRIGDLLISTDAVQHDVDVTTFGYAPGQVPGQAESFVADESLATLAQQASEAVDPTRRVLRGRVVSGDQFISSREVKERLVSQFHGDCAEMEGAAIAQARCETAFPLWSSAPSPTRPTTAPTWTIPPSRPPLPTTAPRWCSAWQRFCKWKGAVSLRAMSLS